MVDVAGLAVLDIAGLAVLDIAGLAVLDIAGLAGTHQAVVLDMLVAVVLVVADLLEILAFPWLMVLENFHQPLPQVNKLEHLI